MTFERFYLKHFLRYAQERFNAERDAARREAAGLAADAKLPDEPYSDADRARYKQNEDRYRLEFDAKYTVAPVEWSPKNPTGFNILEKQSAATVTAPAPTTPEPPDVQHAQPPEISTR